MTRGKQKKKSASFVKPFTKEDGRGYGRGGKRGGKVVVQIYDEDEPRESTSSGGLLSLGGRGQKRAESFQLKYSRRYDELVHAESVLSQKPEISNSKSLRPPAAKRKSTRIHWTGPQNDASHEVEIVNDEPSRGKKSGACKNRKMRKSGREFSDTTVFNYTDEEDQRKTATADEVHSSDMEATPEVVLPATENWAEVVIDRCGNVGNSVASYSPTEGHTWGLGYWNEELSEKIAEEMFKETATAQELNGHDVEAVLDLNRAQMVHGLGEELGRPLRTRKGRQKNSAVRSKEEFGCSRRTKRREDKNSRGFLSIGGLMVYSKDVSDTSDEENSCTDQMDEGFADEDDGYMDFSRKSERGKKRTKDRMRWKKHLSSPDPTRFRAIMLNSSDGDSTYISSDSDVSSGLVEDYLANCEGLSADIDDPAWVSRNQKSIQYPPIDEMDILDEESGSSEEGDLDPESHGNADSGSELEDDVKHRYRITAGVFGRQVIRRSRSEETTVQGDSDVETEELEQKVLFGYDSDSSSVGEDKDDALLSDDEARIRDLELDDEARIRDLELQDNAVLHASVNTKTIEQLVSASVNTETIGELVSPSLNIETSGCRVSASVNTETMGVLVSTSANTETSGALVSTSLNKETIRGNMSGSTEGVLLTSSVATQTMALSTEEAHIQEPGLRDKKVRPLRSNMVPKYRSVGQFVSGLAEEVLLTSPAANQSWPVSTGKTKKSKGVPGQKKMERQETIAEKRRERAVKRGFDIAAVNKELAEMVRLKKDIIAFEPMEQRDRAQVHRLASMYKLKSGSQGTTKRRFVVVSVTKDTGMPSAEDKVRLLKLLREDKSHAKGTTPTSSQTLTGEERRKISKMQRVARQALQGLETPVCKKGKKYRYFTSSAVKTQNTNTKGRSGHRSHTKRSDKKASKTAVLYANNPVSFIGIGTESEDACITPASTASSNPACTMEGIIRSRLSKADACSSGAAGSRSRSSEFADFEAHTNGFASRMMAKMGYVEGYGLGRDKQGIAQPLEAVLRPKSLGLGAST